MSFQAQSFIHLQSLRRYLVSHRISAIILGVILFLCTAPTLLYLLTATRIIGDVPDSDALSQHETLEAARIYSIDGVLLGTYHIENRTSVSLDSVPSFLLDALLATEDHRFYSHSGIDVTSLFRVVGKTFFLMDESSGGGSTLTQQLAKSWYPRTRSGIWGLIMTKFSEMATAREIENYFSKAEILEMYLNSVSFGEEIYGVQAASLRYFSKPCTRLLPQEAALLVGMLKAPGRYHPLKHPNQSKARRNTVLAQMKGYDLTPPHIADSLSRLPIALAYSKKTHHDGLAPHFREHLRQELSTWCRQYEEAYGKKIDLYRSGLRITTSIHSRMQQYAESALKSQMKVLQEKFDRHWKGFNKFKASKGYVEELISRCKQVAALRQDSLSRDSIQTLLAATPATPGFSWSESEEAISVLDSIIMDAFTLQAGMLAMDPTNGHIRAWVGGIDHRYSAFDQVLAARQTGSVFKPLLYVSALENGEDPCMYISNERETYEDFQDWNPRNSDNFYGGQYSMEGALTHSVNVVSARLIMKIGINPVLETARKLGIKRELPRFPAIALGAADISLKEVVSAYSTLANQGKYVEPRFIVRIEDKEGNILADYSSPDPGTRVANEESVTMLTDMLEGVVNKGTARALRSRHKLTMDLAGKTGTTQNQRDGWFLAYNPALVVGARVGGQDPRIHWRSLSLGQGATTALPIVGYFLQATTDDPDFAYLEGVRFPPLSETAKERLDCADFTFPMGMSEFKQWWKARSAADSLRRLGLAIPDSIRVLLQNDWVE